MLFQTALERSNGPIDADHITYVLLLATSDGHTDPLQEQIEQDFLLLLLVHEIRHKTVPGRSFENVFERLNSNEISSVESILKISEYWKSASDEQIRKALLGVRARLLKVLLSDDPNFIAE